MQPIENQQGIYEHYKGKRYQLLYVAKHSETMEQLVVYKQLYGDESIWVRPYAMFFEEVEVNGRQMPRFRRI